MKGKRVNMESKIIDKGSYKVHLIKNDKFKDIQMYIVMRMECSNDDYKVFAAFLGDFASSKYFNSNIERYRKEEELYDTKPSFNISHVGKLLELRIGMNFLNPKYVNEEFLNKAIEHLFMIINNPNYDDKCLEIVKGKLRNIRENIDTSLSSKSIENAINLGIPDSPLAKSFFCKEDVINNLSISDLNEGYNRIFKNANVHIYVAGDVDEKIVNIIDNNAKFNKNKVSDNFYHIEDVRKNVLKHHDFYDSNQSHIVVIYNILNNDKVNNIDLQLFDYILGDLSLSSKLIVNLRVKNSLCYNANSSYSKYSGILKIYTSVDNNNVDRALELINLSVEEMKNKITEEELLTAKNNIISECEDIDNNNASVLFNKINVDLYGYEDKDEVLSYLDKVSINDISKIFNNLKINTIYILGGGNNGKN